MDGKKTTQGKTKNKQSNEKKAKNAYVEVS